MVWCKEGENKGSQRFDQPWGVTKRRRLKRLTRPVTSRPIDFVGVGLFGVGNWKKRGDWIEWMLIHTVFYEGNGKNHVQYSTVIYSHDSRNDFTKTIH